MLACHSEEKKSSGILRLTSFIYLPAVASVDCPSLEYCPSGQISTHIFGWQEDAEESKSYRYWQLVAGGLGGNSRETELSSVIIYSELILQKTVLELQSGPVDLGCTLCPYHTLMDGYCYLRSDLF